SALPDNIRQRLLVSDGCWFWTGEIRKRDGRAIFNKQYVYRILYELLRGPIPEGRVLHHRECNHKGCVNPWHTVAITQGEHLKEHGIAGYPSQLKKTHCPAGHPYDDANTTRTNNGERLCRECLRLRASHRYYANLEVNRQKARDYQRRKRDAGNLGYAS